MTHRKRSAAVVDFSGYQCHACVPHLAEAVPVEQFKQRRRMCDGCNMNVLDEALL